MATSTPGVGSGLDVNSIVTQLVAVERQPLQRLQQQATAIQAQVSSWGKVKSLLDTLGSAAGKLASASTWTQSTVASADPLTVSASLAGSGTASPGRYRVQVVQLAQEQSVASAALAAGADFRGRLTLERGAYDASTPPNFTPASGGSAVHLDFTQNPTTMADLRDAINASAAGIRASIINEGSAQRLVLQGSATGSDAGFRVSVSDPAGVGPTALAGLTYDAGASSAMTLTRQARNASFTINGLALSSAGNTLDGTIEGLRLQLLKETSTTDITVENDTTAQKKLIEEFVSAYNAVNNQIASDTNYDPVSKKGGPLVGDSGALAVRRALREMIGQSSSASTVLARLSDLGLDIKRDGAISINATALASVLNKPTELAKLMSAAGTGTESSKGLGVRLKALIDPMMTSAGLVDSRSQSLRDRLKRNQTDQDRLNDRVEATKQRLLKVYQSLDGKVSQLSGLGNYVSQQFSNRR